MFCFLHEIKDKKLLILIRCSTFAIGYKKTRIHHQYLNNWERNARDCTTKVQYLWNITNNFFEKVFSNKRMERYFALYPNNEERAIKHYQANIKLAEAFYTSLSVLEVALRNALSRELETMTGREDWYAIFPNTPGLTNLNRYVTKATKQIVGRHETITPSKL